MAVLTIRDLNDEVRDKLRVRAAENKRSMEAEVRAILTQAVELSVLEQGFAEALMAFGDAVRESGLELEIPPRDSFARDPFA